MTWYRKNPVAVDMIQWTVDGAETFPGSIAPLLAFVGTSEELRLVDKGDEWVVTFYVAKGQSMCEIRLGDWIARERDGVGFYPITQAAQADSYTLYVDGELHTSSGPGNAYP